MPYTNQGRDYGELPAGGTGDNGFRFLVEVYVDDYIAIATPTTRAQLDHVANGVLMGIHDVFPPNDEDDNDPVSLKKLLKEEGSWALQKDVLGFMFDGNEKTLWLNEEKRDVLLTVLKGWIRASRGTCAGVPFADFESITSKLRHAFTAIPAGKGLLSPLNAILRVRPTTVYLHKYAGAVDALRACRTMLRESTALPTKCKELVMGTPEFIGTKDASIHGVGGVIVGNTKECVPTVFRFEWPSDIKAGVNTEDNPSGRITKSDLEMAGLLLLWPCME